MGAGDDRVIIESIDGHTIIDGNDGNDIFYVGSKAVANVYNFQAGNAESQVDNVRALLVIIGGNGSDSLYIDDRGESGESVGILTGNSLTGLGMPSISEIQTIYVQAATGTYKVRIADPNINPDTATTTLVQLSGTPIHGDIWRVAIDEATDVLSFSLREGEEFVSPDATERLGEVIISLETAERQASEARHSVADEMAHLLVHGILHLLGYDHAESDDERVMRAREDSLLGTTH